MWKPVLTKQTVTQRILISSNEEKLLYLDVSKHFEWILGNTLKSAYIFLSNGSCVFMNRELKIRRECEECPLVHIVPLVEGAYNGVLLTGVCSGCVVQQRFPQRPCMVLCWNLKFIEQHYCCNLLSASSVNIFAKNNNDDDKITHKNVCDYSMSNPSNFRSIQSSNV